MKKTKRKVISMQNPLNKAYRNCKEQDKLIINRKQKAVAINKKLFNIILSTGFPFQLTHEEPKKETVKDKTEMTREKQEDKNTSNIRFKKANLTGHIFCVKCRQWQHPKCVGLNLNEAKLKKANYTCHKCK